MKFKNNLLKYRYGEKAILKKFTWWPTTFSAKEDIRWLEMADVVCEVQSYDAIFSRKYCWVPLRFATEVDKDSIKKDPVEKEVSEWGAYKLLALCCLFLGAIIGGLMFTRSFIGGSIFLVFIYGSLHLYFNFIEKVQKGEV
jgi:hypothetical protein